MDYVFTLHFPITFEVPMVAVVLGIVRTPDHPGFWADARRLTVALTRAKHAFVVVGHGAWAEAKEDTPLGGLFADAVKREVVVA